MLQTKGEASPVKMICVGCQGVQGIIKKAGHKGDFEYLIQSILIINGPSFLTESYLFLYLIFSNRKI